MVKDKVKTRKRRNKKVKRKRKKEQNIDVSKIDLTIRPLPSSKDDIRHPILAKHNVIPKLGTSSIFNGATGMGKSTLLTNLITEERFLGGNDVFDFKFLISPTAKGDDVQKQLDIEPQFVFDDLKEAPILIAEIMKMQRDMIEEQGNDNAPQILMIFDDVISDPEFLRSTAFINSFIASRHYNFTTMVCSQSWTAVPRKCRLQARHIFFFSASLSEVELLALEYAPPGLSKKDFMNVVAFATHEPFSFLHINKSVSMENRFRRNLSEIINIDVFKSNSVKENNGRRRKRGKRTASKDSKHIDSNEKSEQERSQNASRGEENEYGGVKIGHQF